MSEKAMWGFLTALIIWGLALLALPLGPWSMDIQRQVQAVRNAR